MAGRASETRTVVVDKAVGAAERRRRTPQDSEKKNIEGHTNQTDLQPQLDALKGLVGVLNGMDENEPENGTPPNPHDDSTHPRNRSSEKYNNTGDQKIKGLTNQVGCIEGNLNGAINFGELRM